MSRILIIEDNNTMREGMHYCLLKEGHDVDSAEDGREGLSLIKKEGFDLVITDSKLQHGPVRSTQLTSTTTDAPSHII